MMEGGTENASELETIAKTNVAGVVGLALLDINYYYNQHISAMKMEKEGNSEGKKAFRSMLGFATLDRSVGGT